VSWWRRWRRWLLQLDARWHGWRDPDLWADYKRLVIPQERARARSQQRREASTTGTWRDRYRSDSALLAEHDDDTPQVPRPSRIAFAPQSWPASEWRFIDGRWILLPAEFPLMHNDPSQRR
jgi:hypothetical protein